MALPDRVHTQRQRAGSFGAVAAEYDAARPTYPDQLVDDLLADDPADVLDIGCGTGKAGRLFAARRLPVLGVEADPKMAAVARGHGLTIDVAPFETWDARGRTFDLIICGQAWHWIDPALGGPKLASLLRPHATAALFWNRGELDDPVRAALDVVYREHAPELLDARHPATQQPYGRDLRESGRFGRVEERVYRWQRSYTRDEWLALVQTHSDHLLLAPQQRRRLVAGLGAVLDRIGGTLVARYRTETVLARLQP
jgi:SAM-dependent methyltransferase